MWIIAKQLLRGNVVNRSKVSFELLSGIALAFALTSFMVPGAMALDANNVNNSPVQNQPPEVSRDTLWMFIQAGDALSSNLTRIDSALANVSSALSKTGLQGPKAQAILQNFSIVNPAQIDCVTVGLNGSILEIKPDEYSYVKGKDVVYQEHLKRLFATKRPVGMAYIKTVEGFYAVDFAAPVFDEKGCFIGATTTLINATKFMGRILVPYQPRSGGKIWVMRPADGLVLYDTDASQIGLSLDAPMFKQFPDLIALAERIRMNSTGYGSYKFYNDQHTQNVKKGVYWTTIYCQGGPIRLMLTVNMV
jgi:hypothetical protein